MSDNPESGMRGGPDNPGGDPILPEGGDAQPDSSPGGAGSPDRWRKRALEAESKLADLEKRLGELEATLEQSRSALATIERKRQIDRALAEAQPIDLEAAALLTESALDQMQTPDVGAAIGELRRRKPWLFREGRTPTPSGAMAASADPTAEQERLDEGLIRAARSGDRRALLRYLRSRAQR